MIIKMTKVACGPDGSFQPGEIREVDETKGLQLIRANAAINLSPKQPELEAAVIVAPETAVMPTVKGKRR